MSGLEDRLRRLILDHGPISIARYMALAMAHPTSGYYPRHDPLGAAGDFVTAPEVSQMFGELIGLALLQHWLDLGSPQRVALVELGPGRGTLMADAMRAIGTIPQAIRSISIHLVETSPMLRERQAAALPGLPVHWHDELGGVPADRPMLVVANEFLDVLPVRQFVRRSGRWHERLIAVDEETLLRFVMAPRPTPFPEAVGGVDADMVDDTMLELAPAREAMAQAIAMRLAAQGGMALLIDYGSDREVMTGDSLRAVRRHAAADPLQEPGEADLSSHVDFRALARRCASAAAVFGPLPQGNYLKRLGIEERLRQLLDRARPAQRESLENGCRRLLAPEAMGTLFKVLAIADPKGPVPIGFYKDERWR